jgi:hypothetical protein
MSTSDDDKDPHTLSGARVENWSEVADDRSVDPAASSPIARERPAHAPAGHGPRRAPRHASSRREADSSSAVQQGGRFHRRLARAQRAEHVVGQQHEGQEVEVKDLDSAQRDLYLNGIRRLRVPSCGSGDHLIQVGNVTFVLRGRRLS